MILGIDTSNYTTSAAMINSDGEVVKDNRIILSVREGERGLRQSDALFAHIKNMNEITSGMSGYPISAIGVSDRPRNAKDSYMPCFLAGKACASALANVLGVPLYTQSHQEGHIAAAIYGSEDLLDPSGFLCVHMSGGTTEVLAAQRTDIGYEVRLIGGTLDISVGQLIDRIGVLLGFAFPCGAAMDEIYSPCKHEKLRVAVNSGWFNLSGIETKLAREIAASAPEQTRIIAEVFDCAADTLAESVRQAAQASGINSVLFCGGVSGSVNIRRRLIEQLDRAGILAYFAPNGMGADNAVGVARLALRRLRKGAENE